MKKISFISILLLIGGLGFMLYLKSQDAPAVQAKPAKEAPKVKLVKTGSRLYQSPKDRFDVSRLSKGKSNIKYEQVVYSELGNIFVALETNRVYADDQYAGEFLYFENLLFLVVDLDGEVLYELDLLEFGKENNLHVDTSPNITLSDSGDVAVLDLYLDGEIAGGCVVVINWREGKLTKIPVTQNKLFNRFYMSPSGMYVVVLEGLFDKSRSDLSWTLHYVQLKSGKTIKIAMGAKTVAPIIALDSGSIIFHEDTRLVKYNSLVNKVDWQLTVNTNHIYPQHHNSLVMLMYPEEKRITAISTLDGKQIAEYYYGDVDADMRNGLRGVAISQGGKYLIIGVKNTVTTTKYLLFDRNNNVVSDVIRPTSTNDFYNVSGIKFISDNSVEFATVDSQRVITFDTYKIEQQGN